MILRFRLGGVDLSYDNNVLTVGNIFMVVFEGEDILFDISKNIVTISSKNKFTAKVTQPDNTNTGISFESQPEDKYGDNYSMDISDVSVLDFSDLYIIFATLYTNDEKTIPRESINDFTIKLYKANIINYGIALDGYDVVNALMEFDSCNILCDRYKDTPIGINVWCNNRIINNTNINMKNCNIINSRVDIGVGVASNMGNVNNTNITLSGCNINSYTDDILLGVGVWYNEGDISNANVIIRDCNFNTGNKICIGIGTWHNSGKVSNSSVITDSYNMNTNKFAYLGVNIKNDKGEVSNTDVIIDGVVSYYQ